MNYVRVIDPEGVDLRRRRRLKRRKYASPGPNFLWHVDGWDKLAPFGFYIYGAIDGYSRRILWLEVGASNKNPRFIAWHYLEAVRQIGGVPRVIRSDKGTENVVMRDLQQLFRWNNEDDLAGSKSFIQGKSSSNQRIESWWSKLREGGGGWWMNFFKDIRDSGFNLDDPVISEFLKFCFMPSLRKELFFEYGTYEIMNYGTLTQFSLNLAMKWILENPIYFFLLLKYIIREITLFPSTQKISIFARRCMRKILGTTT